MDFYIKDTLWRLKFVRPSSERLKNSQGLYTLGVTDNNIKTVFIADNLTQEKEELVICHELTHCICFEYDIYLPIDLEEWLCNFVAEHGKEIIYLLDDLLSVIMVNVA